MTDGAVKNGHEDAFIGRWVFPKNDDPLEMVGRNNIDDLDWLCGYIASLLRLSNADVFLDLCCGNGILTVRIASRVKHVVGVDFSETLLAQARRIAWAPNIEYRQADARVVSGAVGGRKFEKILISYAFQYFDSSAARHVLDEIRKLIKPNGLVCIMDLPDRSRKNAHYMRVVRRLIWPAKGGDRIPKRRYPSAWARLWAMLRYAAHFVGLRKASDLGWWWSRSDFAALGKSCGFDVEILDQPERSPLWLYRFDALLRPKADWPAVKRR